MSITLDTLVMIMAWFIRYNCVADLLFTECSVSIQGETESVTIKSCVRKTTDALDRRFCLDIELTDRYVGPAPPDVMVTVNECNDAFLIHKKSGHLIKDYYCTKLTLLLC